MQEKDVEVHEARRCRENVRRRLFVDENSETGQNGDCPDNHKQLHEDNLKLHKEELEKAKKRWNFDFEEEKPLPGNYMWTKVKQDDKKCEAKEIEKTHEAPENDHV